MVERTLISGAETAWARNPYQLGISTEVYNEFLGRWVPKGDPELGLGIIEKDGSFRPINLITKINEMLEQGAALDPIAQAAFALVPKQP